MKLSLGYVRTLGTRGFLPQGNETGALCGLTWDIHEVWDANYT
jgi:hypothetical protein